MKMRQVMAGVLTLALVTLSACGANNSSSEPAAEEGSTGLTVLTTMFPEYDFAKKIAGDRAEVSLLIPPGADAHSYEPSPGDMKAIQKADLLFYTNPVMNHWISELPDRLDTDKVQFVNVSQKVPKLAMPKEDTLEALLANSPLPKAIPVDDKTAAAGEAEAAEHEHDEADHDHDHHDAEEATHDHDHEHDQAVGEEAHDHEGTEDSHDQEAGEEAGHHHHHENDPYDPHTWTGIRNDIIIAETIRDALIEKDPAGKDDYTKNCKTLTEELQALDKEYTALGEKADNRPLVVADEFPFLYLANDYGFTFVPVLSSYGEHGEASARRIAQISDLMRDKGISVLYYTEQTTPKLARQLADDTGAETLMLHAGHTISEEDLKKGLSYTDILRQNLESLKKGLAVTN
ncbi:metal ABC transporter substrate-binding protein [Peptococcus simiae]|uniref:Metal ABC transporter substrate-binding protein n=1 Tax=Peptococcus simiae TaxID=1643805 RepID=A0ABW9GXK5_9FIRM